MIESDFYEETNCFGADHQIEVGDKCEKDKEVEEVTKFSVKYVIAKVPLLTEFFICVTFTTFIFKKAFVLRLTKRKKERDR